ncbi:MAG: SPFH domain-containing protein [candidate division WOR-3 bacterium]
MLKIILILLILWIIGYIIYRYGVKIILSERKGEVIAIKKFSVNPLIIGSILTGFILLYFLISIKNVATGYILLKFNIFTKKYTYADEGIQFIPFLIYKTYSYDTRRQEYTMISGKFDEEKGKKEDAFFSYVKEGLMVGVELTLWFRLNRDKIIDIHKYIGPDYLYKVIEPAFKGVAKNVISSYSIKEIYSEKREEAEKKIEEKIKEVLEKDGFLIEKVILKDIKLPPDFLKAVEEKKVAEEKVKEMEYILEKEKKEAERKKIEAEGKAEAIRIISEELKKNPQYIKYLYVEKLADNVKVIISDQGTILDLKGILEK